MYRAQLHDSYPNTAAATGPTEFTLTVRNGFGFDLIVVPASPPIAALKVGDWLVYEKATGSTGPSVTVLPPAKLEFSQAQSADDVRKALDKMVRAIKTDNPADVEYPASPATRKRLADAIFWNLRGLRQQYSLPDGHAPIADFVLITSTVPPGYQEFAQALAAPLPA